MALEMEVTRAVRDGLRRGNTAQAYTLTNENSTVLLNHFISAESTFGALTKISLVEAQPFQPSKTIAEMSPELLKNFWEQTDGHTLATTQYRQIKNNDHWKALQGAATRSITYCTRDDTIIQIMVNETLVCKGCNVVMTLEATTIDHRHPKQGGQKSAAYKALRAIGVTKDEPTGRKGTSFFAFSDLAKDRSAPPVGDLTYRGIIMISCLVYANKINEFSQQCLNHIVNLQPMCFRCNSQKGNWGY
jgi:5-methylcytosine-specific restriction endonuclease McrA